MTRRPTLTVSRPLVMLVAIVAVSSAAVAPPANAGVLKRTTAAVGYLKNLVGGGTDLVREGMLGNLRAEDYDRRADTFLRNQAREGLKTFAEISADGQARIATGWKGLKGRLADTVLSKMASTVRDKLWEVFPSGAGKTGPRKTAGRRGRGAGVWQGGSSVHDDPPDAGTAAGRNRRANDVDPVLALDIDDDELPWYRAETGILDQAPLPRVHTSHGIRSVPPVADRGDVARRGCHDSWDGCRDKGQVPSGGESSDGWGKSDEVGRGHAAARWDEGPGDVGRDPHEPADDSHRNYTSALADLSVRASPKPPARAASTAQRDYRSALDDLKAQARENARIEEQRAAAREALRPAASRVGEAETSAAASGVRSSGSPAGTPAVKRPSRRAAASPKPTGPCATGPICKRYAKRGEALVQTVKSVVDRKRLDITGNSLALAFITRASMACVRACIEREETRAHCQKGLRNAIRELQRTYKSAIDAARSASGNSSYVNRFDASPQASSFSRKHLSHVRVNIDTCNAKSQ